MKRNLSFWLRHGLFILYWCFYDLLLTAWTRAKNENHIGRYVKVMSPSEFAFLFSKETAGCGYTGFTLLKIWYKKEYCTPHRVENLLTHEILHQVLRRRIGAEASHKLDNVHKVQLVWGNVDFQGFN